MEMNLSKKQTEQCSQILESLYLKGPLTRAELSKHLHITPATMSGLTAYLLGENLLTELGVEDDPTKAPRRKVMLDIHAQQAFYVGLELMEARIILCLTDNMGQLMEQTVIEMETIGGLSQLTEEMVIQMIQSFLEEHVSYKVRAIGVAVPGHYHKGNSYLLSNHPFWSRFNISRIEEAFELPIFIKNNVKCMALRELYLNRENKVSNFLFLNLRKGMFASYIYNNKIYGEENVLVGEIGHIVVDPYGERCECGKEGCLQTHASISWLLKKAKYLFEQVPDTVLTSLVNEAHELTLTHLITAYRMGDSAVKRLIDKATRALALQINNSLMMLDLDAVYIHGKLFEDPVIAEKLMTHIQQSPSLLQMNRQIVKEVKTYRIERGALGACALAIQKDFIGPTAI